MANPVAAKKRSADAESPPVKLEITDVEKKRGLSKFYLYVIQVTCGNGSQYTIYRRYKQFDEMQRLLEQRFPVEAGEFSQKERVLPHLPGKILFGRSAVREVTEKRLPQLNDYLRQLFSLPDNIRYDSIVRAFTRQSNQDRQTGGHGNQPSQERPGRKPIQPPRPTFPVPTPVRKKSPAPPRPAPPTKPAIPSPVQGPRAKALYQYTGQYGDELSFPAGAVIALLRQVDQNWFQGRLNGQIGLVPVNYISIVQSLPKQDSQDDLEQSDEWDSDPDDTDMPQSTHHITYYVRGVAHTAEVAEDLLHKPTLNRLRNIIQDKLGRRNFVLNYKDSSGDLIEIVDQSDLNMMMSEGTSPHKSGSTHWALYVTDQGDHTPYNTHPYSR